VAAPPPASESPRLKSGESGCPDDASEIGKASGCEGCPGRVYCLSQSTHGVRADPILRTLHVRMRAIKHKILVLSGKGGVGKSTVATQLAMSLASRGHRVAMLDLDICGPSVPKLLRCEDGQVKKSPHGWIPVRDAIHGIDLISVAFLLASQDDAVIWRGPRKTDLVKRMLAETYWGKKDYLIIDTPPGTSDEHLTIVKALEDVNLDGGIVVTSPQEVSAGVVRKELDFCRKTKLRVLGLVENMSGYVCPCCQEVTPIFGVGAGERLSSTYELPLLASIPLDPILCSGAEQGNAVMPNSAAGQALSQLVENLLRQLSVTESSD